MSRLLNAHLATDLLIRKNRCKPYVRRLTVQFMLLMFLLIVPFGSFSQIEIPRSKLKRATRPAKVMTNNHYVPILINNLINYYSNAGDGSFQPNTSDNEGLEFPKGSGKTTAFEDGLVWGCVQNGSFKVGGSTYYHGLQAGRILASGSSGVFPIADNPNLLKYRVYRVRSDVNPAIPFASVQSALLEEQQLMQRSDASVTAQSIYDQYIADWNEWPAADGAPYKDVNKNGTYEPGTDIPGVDGADQTLWHVSNDLDSSRVYNFSGSAPIGLEVQRTIWAFHRQDALGNSIFLRYRLINKSGATLDSMFVAQWTDPDIGTPPDGPQTDYIGFDTTRNLGFGYKANSMDTTWGATPPSIGMILLQGPSIAGLNSDSILFDFKWRRGYKSIKLSSFFYIVGPSATYADPSRGNPISTTQWYRILHGTLTSTGAPFLNPLTSQPTKFCVSGDPVTGCGWVDGIAFGPADRRMVETTGPFRMAASDTQEVVIAVTIGQGSNRLASVTALKSSADRVRSAFINDPVTSVPALNNMPLSFSVTQNYPNPFNPSTTIRYKLPTRSQVTLKIFDLLGREVATLVNEEKLPGTYTISWHASNMASGIYFYKLTAGGYVQTKKMVLLR